MPSDLVCTMCNKRLRKFEAHSIEHRTAKSVYHIVYCPEHCMFCKDEPDIMKVAHRNG